MGHEEIDTVAIDSEQTALRSKELAQLSGDLDLPLEVNVCQDPPMVLRICSDFSAAYSIYYVEDEPMFASLVLSGNDDEAEFELMQVFRYLLLDDSDEEDPSEEEVEATLNREEFLFIDFEQRPIVFQIRLTDEPEFDDLSQKIADIDQSVSAAFLDHPQVRDE